MIIGLIAFWVVFIFSLIVHASMVYVWISDNEFTEYIKKKKEAIIFCIPIFGTVYLLYLVVSKKIKGFEE